MAEETVKDVLKRVVGLAKTEVKGWEEKIAQTLQQNNIEPGMHVGQAQDFFNEADHVIEWLLGQMASALNHDDENLKGAGMKHLVERGEELLKGAKNDKASKNVQK